MSNDTIFTSNLALVLDAADIETKTDIETADKLVFELLRAALMQVMAYEAYLMSRGKLKRRSVVPRKERRH